jgi:hypothetical protein
MRRRQTRFLEVYAGLGVIGSACKAAGVPRGTVERWQAIDKKFARMMLDAFEEARDAVEQEVCRRALDGWDEPVYHGGKMVGSIRRYDSNLLIALMKVRKPEFREQKGNQTNNITTSTLPVVPLERLTVEELALLEKIRGNGTR